MKLVILYMIYRYLLWATICIDYKLHNMFPIENKAIQRIYFWDSGKL